MLLFSYATLYKQMSFDIIDHRLLTIWSKNKLCF